VWQLLQQGKNNHALVYKTIFNHLVGKQNSSKMNFTPLNSVELFLTLSKKTPGHQVLSKKLEHAYLQLLQAGELDSCCSDILPR
jgi:hypothetical protein